MADISRVPYSFHSMHSAKNVTQYFCTICFIWIFYNACAWSNRMRFRLVTCVIIIRLINYLCLILDWLPGLFYFLHLSDSSNVWSLILPSDGRRVGLLAPVLKWSGNESRLALCSMYCVNSPYNTVCCRWWGNVIATVSGCTSITNATFHFYTN